MLEDDCFIGLQPRIAGSSMCKQFKKVFLAVANKNYLCFHSCDCFFASLPISRWSSCPHLTLQPTPRRSCECNFVWSHQYARRQSGSCPPPYPPYLDHAAPDKAGPARSRKRISWASWHRLVLRARFRRKKLHGSCNQHPRMSRRKLSNGFVSGRVVRIASSSTGPSLP